MSEIIVTGGARIGLVDATWPFAKLSASPVGLRLKCLLDSYDFAPSQVVSLEPHGSFLRFHNGLRVVHARSDYPSKIVFWCQGNPEELISRIRQAGFLPTAPASSEVRWRGMPFRWTWVGIFLVAWHALFLVPVAAIPDRMNREPAFACLPLLFAFLVAWSIKSSPTVQNMVLSDGHSVNEVKGFLSMIQFVSAPLCVVFAILQVVDLLRYRASNT